MKSLHLAGPEDLGRLVTLVSAFHSEQRLEVDYATVEAALTPLLEGQPVGAVWLIGPRKAPVGYVSVSFGWSLRHGGLDATIDELYIRPAVRRRGMGGEALHQLTQGLRQAGVTALRLAIEPGDERLDRFFRRARFQEHARNRLLTRVF
ncbi:MAG: N-acetyltransferase [Rhodobacteraceae bacterium]|jgi:L-amino acid N-acyltransferase YncA|uniref:Acetyltransferase (GNAT) family protein n=1 Tax=Salipiger profundus TaxID=1229727 RepID=A0A1U7DA71_9RHOB|nr:MULTISPECIES: GNAT family N-acetyltransferase [Salipiger]APX25061.1 acetyltransferase (GNAT) family protein [Salipiger profundus]MAB07568.1 N-acetyltransferase [Paracoccaceae bacterium]GGA15114.1 hypothetical protein GCM10011326_29330 [Salipiger profundus]SFD11689.1 Acetyltransferase (GNAT) family protein [Salipiger profundus]